MTPDVTVTVTAEPASPVVGWFAKVKSTLGFDKLHISTDTIIELCLYFGAGFLVGFLLKRLSTYLVALVFAFIVIFILHEMGILTLTFNLDKFQSICGTQPVGEPHVSFVMALWAWCKAHIAYVLSFLLGFFIGLKVS